MLFTLLAGGKNQINVDHLDHFARDANYLGSFFGCGLAPRRIEAFAQAIDPVS